MGSIASTLEKSGIPTVAVINEPQNARYYGAVLSSGLIDYPVMPIPQAQIMTDAGAKLAAEQSADFVVAGLTKFAPRWMKKDAGGKNWVPISGTLTYEGADYAEALQAFNQSYLQEMMWGDGLPLEPPTQAKVDALMKAVPISMTLPTTTSIGIWGPAGAYFSTEKIAVNAAMAGARPEYMPVIVAALRAITSVKWDNYGAVMKSAVPLVVVNGPVAAQIGLNASSNAFGPNAKYPANATIGRAIQLSMRNIGVNGHGLQPSNLAGNPASYAGMVIAEAEELEGLAKGWDPLSVQLGFKKGANVVTVLGVDQMDMSLSGGYSNVAAYAAPDKNIWPKTKDAFAKRTAGVVVVSPMLIVTDGLMKGVTKADIQKEMYDKARIPQEEFKSLVLTDEDGKAVEPTGFVKDMMAGLKLTDTVPIAANPNNFLVVASGGL